MSISIDINTAQNALHAAIHLAQQFGLSSYNAAYLEQARLENLPLATLDKQLQAAVREAASYV